MLKTLVIKDYALIENISVDFTTGLNIVTGETGAGKSILIDALGLLLGNRASTHVVRKDAAKAIVEGVFKVDQNKKIANVLKQNNIDIFEELIVRREISVKGNNRCFLNDTPVHLSLLNETGNLLIDLHGQHDHQSLLKVATHLELLDEYGDYSELLSKYKFHYTKLSEINKELFLLKGKESKLFEEREAYEFQLKEINEVSPISGEEEELKSKLKFLENSERLIQLTNEIYSISYENENSIHDGLAKVSSALNELAEIDDTFAEKKSEIENSLEAIRELAKMSRSYADRVDLESNELETIRERLGAISLIKKRYGGTIENVLEHRDKLIEELKVFENFAEKIEHLEAELNHQRHLAGVMANELSAKRKSLADEIIKSTVAELQELGMKDAEMVIKIENNTASEGSTNYLLIDDKKYKFNSLGIDEVEFFISANLGEDPKPLRKIASGGEISRIMLALKSVLAKSDKLPLLIFDEIDTGVSGRIADKVGTAIKSLSTHHQIIAITHLPQIASKADSHLKVEKIKLGTRTVSSIKALEKAEAVYEVAKLLSGEEVTEANLASAKELIENKNGA
jgi:DNA repair protein RecN (Recombination protein N)